MEEEKQITCPNCGEPKFFSYLSGTTIILACPSCGRKMGLPIKLPEQMQQKPIQKRSYEEQPMQYQGYEEAPETEQEPETELEEIPQGPKRAPREIIRNTTPRYMKGAEKYMQKQEEETEEELESGSDEEVPKEFEGNPEEADSPDAYRVKKQDFIKAVQKLEGREVKEKEPEHEPPKQEKPKKFKKMQENWRDKLKKLLEKEDDEDETNNEEDE